MVAAKLLLLTTLAALVIGCGSSDPAPSVGDVTTSPQGKADMDRNSGQPPKSGGTTVDPNR